MASGRPAVALIAVLLLAMACDSQAPDTAAAVDHVSEVLAAAGRSPAGLVGLVRFDCGPADEVLGRRVTDQPITVEVPWQAVAPVVEEVGERAPQDAATAGTPAPSDGFVTSGDGWQVRWTPSTSTDAAATLVTVVGGGPLDAADLSRWEADGTVDDVAHCG
jgi:hypothetical protein